MLGLEEMEIDKVDKFASAGPSVRESSLVAVHEFKVHSTVRLVPFLQLRHCSGKGHPPVLLPITTMGSPLAPHMSRSHLQHPHSMLCPSVVFWAAQMPVVYPTGGGCCGAVAAALSILQLATGAAFALDSHWAIGCQKQSSVCFVPVVWALPICIVVYLFEFHCKGSACGPVAFLRDRSLVGVRPLIDELPISTPPPLLQTSPPSVGCPGPAGTRLFLQSSLFVCPEGSVSLWFFLCM